MKKVRVSHHTLVAKLVDLIQNADTDTLEAIAVGNLSVVDEAEYNGDTDEYILNVNDEFSLHDVQKEFQDFGPVQEVNDQNKKSADWWHSRDCM